MKELCLINASNLKKCRILDGHALRILDALKKRPTPAPAPTGGDAADFMRHRKKRMAEAHRKA